MKVQITGNKVHLQINLVMSVIIFSMIIYFLQIIYVFVYW
jgi:hypothetical protein